MSIITINTDPDMNNPEFFTNYLNNMKTTPEKRQELLNQGQLQNPSTELGVDKVINKSMLLQYALQNPKLYIKKRNDYILKTKEELNAQFINIFNDLKTVMIESEARATALEAIDKFYKLKMEVLEKLYPSQFSDKAYQNEINRQINQSNLDRNTV